MPDRRLLVDLIDVRDLPTLPQVVVRVLEAARDDNSSAGDLTAILEQDHAISARVLRLANSAFYGMGQRVHSIRRAVVVLGFDAVTHLALASSVFRTLSEQRQFALDPQDFWLHAFGAGKAAQLLAEEIDGEEEPGCCFTAGLLHDVGKYVMALVLGERYQGIVERAAAEGCFLREAELAELGLDHADVGQWLAERWHFPPRLADCIGYHYKPARYRGPYASEVRVVAASSELSRASGFGNAGEPESKSAEVSEIPALGLTRDRLAALTETLSALHGEARRFLGLLSEE